MARPAPAPRAPAYVYQEYPHIMHHSNPEIKRTQNAESREHEEILKSQGYQRGKPDPPVVTPAMTKEQAIERLQAQFDAAWSKKVSECDALVADNDKLRLDIANVKAEKDVIAKRLRKLTEREPDSKKGATAGIPAADANASEVKAE